MSPKKKDNREIYLPVLVELAFRFSGLFLVLVSLAVAIVSFLSGAIFLQIILRTGTTMLVMGVLLNILASKISMGALEIARSQLVEAETSSPDPMENLENAGTDIKA